MNNKEFNDWLADYTPLPQEILSDTYPKDVRGMSFTELHAFRYRLTLERLIQSVSLHPGDFFLDIGPFPGGWASLIAKNFGASIKIDLLGLGMTPEFKERFTASRFHFIDFDVDIKNPICKNPGLEIPLASGRYKAISLLETIEHLYNPLPLLHKIGESLAPDGRLIITTDNPAWFGFAYQSLRNKRSIWGPVQESHLFTHNDWRPHMRLYTLQDLSFILESTGLQVIESCYFNDHFSLYALKRGKLKFRLTAKTFRAKIPSLLLSRRLWANRILIVASAKTAAGKSR